ncbi:hypothetical protein D3OALGA1CA_5271 [Olavius algarvensis associated proteobacterium Delta 3]|nr:hypothetical protein D3OALGB2SA_529 [Olavius algarvensis associated proteobacterium Delta 3]CAB5164337.1 hypothetical protein D3OALGA1CA_5271 [Olavius algarvensis associated proteobacterium Delta 3]
MIRFKFVLRQTIDGGIRIHMIQRHAGINIVGELSKSV